jgi:DNA-binding beta-propeller fold protein YncE
MTIDATGNRYVAETGNRCLRRIDVNGVITTVAGALDPVGTGPLASGRFADPRAFVLAPAFTFVAGGSSGTLQASRSMPPWLEVVAGRYPQPSTSTALARLRDQSFGSVTGVAFDAAAGVVYLSEGSQHRLDVVTIVDADDASTWTIAPLANPAGTAGHADGAVSGARFREPAGLYFDPDARQLYITEAGNHVVRAMDLSTGIAGATVRTIAGIPEARGFFGNGAAATSALFNAPQAITRCSNGDLFVADTSNHRVRRIAAGTNVITTVLGDGSASSSGEGGPATSRDG